MDKNVSLSSKKDLEEKGVEKIKKELEETNKKAEEYLNNWKRIQADYVNRERSMEKERENWIKFSNLNLVLELLPIFDHFNQALSHVPGDDIKSEWVKGIIQIKGQIEKLLKGFGVEKIKTIGEKFNPKWHEVISKEKTEDNPSETPLRGNPPTGGVEGQVVSRGKDIIIKEVQAGYKMHESIIKPAKVIISE